MRKILRDDIEVEIDKSGTTGLFAEFEHEDILKRLTSIRTFETKKVTEVLTLDQTAGTALYQSIEAEEATGDKESAALTSSAIRRIIDYATFRNACDFCGLPHSKENKVIAGPTLKICAGCIRICRDVLDETGVE